MKGRDIKKKNKINPDQWDQYMPDLIDKLCSAKNDVRMIAIETILDFFKNRFIGDDFLPFAEKVYESLKDSIFRKELKNEQESALNLICVLSMNLGIEFEEHANEFVRTILTYVKEIGPNELNRFFAVAFLTRFSFNNEESCQVVLERLLTILNNKRSRPADFNDDYFIAIIESLSIVITCISHENFFTQNYDNTTQLIDNILEEKLEIVYPSLLRLIALISEKMTLYEESPSCNSFNESQSFISRYKSQISEIESRDNNLLQIIEDTISYLDGGNISEQYLINGNEVWISGHSKKTIISAIHKVCGGHIIEQLEKNVRLQWELDLPYKLPIGSLRVKTSLIQNAEKTSPSKKKINK